MEFDRFGSYRTLLFDPQGSNVASTEALIYYGGNITGTTWFPVFYDSYGAKVWNPSGNAPYLTLNRATSQPFQYKGQFGYYTDGATGLNYCLNRYYDPLVGRWTSRDPSGLDGGVNVYQYCDGDPVSLSDSDGSRPMNSNDYRRIHALYTYARGHKMTHEAMHSLNIAKNAIESAIADAGNEEPANLQAIWWAIDHLGDKSFAKGAVLEVPGITDFAAKKWKCNAFACMAYSIGAGLGWDGVGVPTQSKLFGFRGHPYLANEIATTGRQMENFPVGTSPAVGDITAFHVPVDSGHCTLWLGGGLLIYAGQFDVKLGLVRIVMAQDHHDRKVFRRYRH